MAQGNIPFGNIPEAPAGLPHAEEGATWPQRISGDGPGTSRPAKSRVAWPDPRLGSPLIGRPLPCTLATLAHRSLPSGLSSLSVCPYFFSLISIPSLSIALQQQSVNIALHPTPDKPPLIS